MRLRGVRVAYLFWLVCGVWVLAGLVGCGGGGGDGGGGGGGQGTGTPPSTTQSGEVRVTLSDPPICKVPQGDLSHVWVTVTLVRAHLSNSASPDDSGWVNLVDLRSAPKQIDLLSTSDTTCVLTMLGSTTGLPPGDYQQIRLHLLSNTPASGEALPSPNMCTNLVGTSGFNCVELNDRNHTQQLIRLSSEAQTGIKIPPGQITGGAIRLTAGQAADMNIDFDACRSIVLQGNGAVRLKPTLHAGEVALTTQAISGQVVDQTTRQPIPDATIMVMAEQLDADGIDRVVLQTLASTTQGTFSLCPLPPGNYDIVSAALSTAGVTYNATITVGVAAGTAMGPIPLVPERGGNTSPGAIAGQVTTTANEGGTGADIALSALQTVTPTGGAPIQVTIPLLTGSTPNVATERTAGCPGGTDCATYMLALPPSNPLVGTFAAAGTVYAGPAGGNASYSVNAQAFIPGTAGTSDCAPASLFTPPPLVSVRAGTVSQAATLAFTGCTPGF